MWGNTLVLKETRCAFKRVIDVWAFVVLMTALCAECAAITSRTSTSSATSSTTAVVFTTTAPKPVTTTKTTKTKTTRFTTHIETTTPEPTTTESEVETEPAVETETEPALETEPAVETETEPTLPANVTFVRINIPNVSVVGDAILWSVPSNWIGGVVPSPTDNVLIDLSSVNCTALNFAVEVDVHVSVALLYIGTYDNPTSECPSLLHLLPNVSLTATEVVVEGIGIIALGPASVVTTPNFLCGYTCIVTGFGFINASTSLLSGFVAPGYTADQSNFCPFCFPTWITQPDNIEMGTLKFGGFVNVTQYVAFYAKFSDTAHDEFVWDQVAFDPASEVNFISATQNLSIGSSGKLLMSWNSLVNSQIPLLFNSSFPLGWSSWCSCSFFTAGDIGALNCGSTTSATSLSVVISTSCDFSTLSGAGGSSTTVSIGPNASMTTVVAGGVSIWVIVVAVVVPAAVFIGATVGVLVMYFHKRTRALRTIQLREDLALKELMNVKPIVD